MDRNLAPNWRQMGASLRLTFGLSWPLNLVIYGVVTLAIVAWLILLRPGLAGQPSGLSAA